MKKKLPFIKSLVLAASLCASVNVFGQTPADSAASKIITDSTQTDFTSLSLEDLMNVQVTVASKKSESIADAPGSITAYSSKDIERYGYYSIADLSNITPGYSSFTAFGEQNLETRGQKAGSWNVNKTLVLIDGIPVNHARANSAPVDNQLPLLFADQVEFLRGPGSALYGTSAFYGVISAKSKVMTENGTTGSVKMTFGTMQNEKRLMATVSHKTDNGQTNISTGYYGRDYSATPLGNVDSLRHDQRRLNFDNALTYFIYANHTITAGKLKGLGGGIMSFTKSSHGGEFWNNQTSPNNEIRWDEFIPYVKYKRDITNKFSINSYVKYNHSVEKGIFETTWNGFSLVRGLPYSTDSISGAPIGVQSTFGYNYTFNDIEGLVEGNYKLGENSNIIVGLNYDTRKQTNSPTSYEWGAGSPNSLANVNTYTFNNDVIGTPWFNTYSAYAQYQGRVNILKGLLITGGFRYDKGVTPTNQYSQLSPRLSLVQKITDKWNVKVMYGQALRAPGIKEISLNAESKTNILRNGGDPSGIHDVGAEIMRSFEAGTNLTLNRFTVGVVGFYNQTINPLDGKQYTYTDRSGKTQSVNAFANISGDIKSQGLEIDAKYALNKNFIIMANHAVAKATINDSIQFIKVPTQKTNIAASYTLPGKLKLTSTLVYKKVWGFYVSKAEYNTNIIDGYSNLDLNVLFPVTSTIGFEVQVKNILDNKWYQPAEGGHIMDIRMPGRRALISLTARF